MLVSAKLMVARSSGCVTSIGSLPLPSSFSILPCWPVLYLNYIGFLIVPYKYGTHYPFFY